MNLKKSILLVALLPLLSILPSCSDDDPQPPVIDPPTHSNTLFVVNNGAYGYGNASLSVYNPVTTAVDNEVFQRANGMRLGDVAQSMTMGNGLGWIVVNQSGVVFAIDPDTYREKGRITGLTAPRNIFFVNEHKAYISHLYTDYITVFDPTTYSVTGRIDVPGMAQSTGSTEQMLEAGGYVYCNCWSYQNSIIKIDPVTDTVVASLAVGIQPESMAMGADGHLYVLCDGGGWEQNPVGYEAPSLQTVDLSAFAVTSVKTFPLGDSVSKLTASPDKKTLYWINGGIQSMSITAASLPTDYLIEPQGTWYYGITVSPDGHELYVADAVDFVQPGIVRRYTAAGYEESTFRTGICPASFCWR